MNILFSLLFSLVGGIIERGRGMGLPWGKYFPRPYVQMFLALPYGFLVYHNLGLGTSIVLKDILPVLAWAGAFGAFATGNAVGQSLGTDDDPIRSNALEFIIKPLKGHIPAYWYDALFLSVCGMVVTLPAGIILLNPWLAVAGALKGLAYMIGRWGEMSTEGGEFITGLFLWGIIPVFLN